MPGIFGPTYGDSAQANLRGNSAAVIDQTLGSVINNVVGSSSSFRYDAIGTGVKSTQQLPLDWSKFENHTFFNSAQAKTNIAFEKVINEFPFDGTRDEIEQFLDELTGFEKYVYDSMPKYLGYLNFDLTNHLEVKDRTGVTIPEMSRDTTGKSVLNPELSSYTIFSYLFVPEIANGNQIIAQKLNGSTAGYTVALSSSALTTSCSLCMFVSSGSSSYMSASVSIPKGSFISFAAQHNRTSGVDNVQLYVNGELAATSSDSVRFGQIDFIASSLLIGSGTNHAAGSFTFSPASRFTGSLDEFRIYHRNFSTNDLIPITSFPDYRNNDLKVYFKFNEPTGSYSNSGLAIDHSGNGLHTSISNYQASQRVKGLSTPLLTELEKYNVTLFSDHPDVVSLNAELLASGSEYDANNPNMITKLIPQHYLKQEQEFYNLDSIEGEVGQSIDTNGTLPGKTKLGSVQIISALLYIWAKQFDEVKCHIDHVSRLRNVGYTNVGTVSDQFLPALADYYGIQLPNMFSGVGLELGVVGESSRPDVATLRSTYQYTQNLIWRRILKELPSLVRSKGTIHSIKSMIRAAGIEPESIMKFREYGGKSTGYIIPTRSPRSIVQGFLNFSGSLVNFTTASNPQGIYSGVPFLSSSYLSGSRYEPGGPPITGNPADGLFTSGSWSYEAIYKFGPGLQHNSEQSLARLHVTGTSLPSLEHGIASNLVVTKGSTTSSIDLYVAPNFNRSDFLRLTITGSNIFDGENWHISFGRSGSYTEASSSYYLWASRLSATSPEGTLVTGSLFDSGSAWNTLSTTLNASGTFLCIGPQETGYSSAYPLLNSSSFSDTARQTIFSGKVARVRFWTKRLTLPELNEHATNFESVGVENPALNYNFVTRVTGSWERLRIDAWASQEITSSYSNGTISLVDYSQNNFNLAGQGFQNSARVIDNERVMSSVPSLRFDEASADNKIRIRSLQEPERAPNLHASVAPMYEIPRSEEPSDDLRFSIEVSAIRSLDEDIAKIFATLDELDDAIGAPEMQFSPDYVRLEVLRDVYFNRLTERIKMKQLYEFFRWFDLSMGSLIENFVPSNTRFLGSNFVIEPHVLERSKVQYLNYGTYVRLFPTDPVGEFAVVRVGR